MDGAAQRGVEVVHHGVAHERNDLASEDGQELGSIKSGGEEKGEGKEKGSEQEKRGGKQTEEGEQMRGVKERAGWGGKEGGGRGVGAEQSVWRESLKGNRKDQWTIVMGRTAT